MPRCAVLEPRKLMFPSAALLLVVACATLPVETPKGEPAAAALYRPARALTGKIIADGVGGNVLLRSKRDSSLELGGVDRENAFSFEVPDGAYSLAVHRDGYEDAFIDDIEVANGVARLPPVTLKRAGPSTQATVYRPPRKISGPNPEYTQEALRHHVEGLFVTKCRVPLSGTLGDCRVLKHLPPMDDSILYALQHRRYEPAVVDGVPTETDYVFKVELRLPR